MATDSFPAAAEKTLPAGVFAWTAANRACAQGKKLATAKQIILSAKFRVIRLEQKEPRPGQIARARSSKACDGEAFCLARGVRNVTAGNLEANDAAVPVTTALSPA